ncbi:MAG: LacI family DNA-binding transcriptional regulator [Eubacteriales bacterium]|nr:LacI family DNA-binding transcriptional regulator [Eubacteriales bacterium]
MTTTKIAEIVGVSRGAVDKTIHGRPGVREDVRERILQVMEETGYVPLSERKKVQAKQSVKTVAVILPGPNNPYFTVLRRYLEELGALMPALQLVYFPCNTANAHEVLKILKQLKTQPIDGYLLRGVRSEQIRNELDQQARPVIFFDSDVPNADRLCLVGEDCVKSGRLAASLIAKSIGGAGQIAVISGSTNISSHQQRLGGFYDVMRSDYPDVHVVRQIYSQEQPVMAYQLTRRLLEDYPNLAGICNLAGCSCEIGLAILERRAKQTVALVCFGTDADVSSLIRKKIVTFSIGLQPREQARILLETMHRYLTQDKRPKESFIRTPITIALDENMDSLNEDFGEQ